MNEKNIQNSYQYKKGSPFPLGTDFRDGGINFSVFSSDASEMELLLFDSRESTEPFQRIKLKKKENCDFGFWNIFVEGLKSGVYYAYKSYNPCNIGINKNINNKVLLDPYAKGIDTYLWDYKDALITSDKDNTATSMRGCVIDVSDYRWENIKKPNIPFKETIIYEMNVKGLTYSISSGVKCKGTFTGVIEKIPHLKSLGVNTVELMPIMQFDEKESNFWGYNTIGFFAPHSGYCISTNECNQVNEFRNLVKEFHKEGIEVFLDVVYNHTREGNEKGPVINFKGFDNDLYYSLSNDGKYNNYSGCGNSLSCNHPIVQKLILESLEYWADKMQVDGFRFDLGSVLTLDTHGNVLEYPPVLWGIELDKDLKDCKLIAEPWGGDNSGKLYQIGNIHGFRWSQWNGKYRDCIRRFVKGDPGMISEVATRVSGSPDLFQSSCHLPINSVNFITCHDGLTLNDLVSYTNDEQFSWNCGEEGPTNNLEINKLRLQQIKNFMAILFMSKGIPMILSGDEMRRSQNGDANGYTLDNEQGYVNWDLLEQNRETFKFFQKMIQLRKQAYLLQIKHFYTGKTPENHTRGLNDINWHGTKLNRPEWKSYSRVLSFTIAGVNVKEEISPHPETFKDEDIHVMMNMYWEPLTFEIPKIEGRNWFLYTDTSKEQNDEDILYSETTYEVKARSIVILVSKNI